MRKIFLFILVACLFAPPGKAQVADISDYVMTTGNAGYLGLDVNSNVVDMSSGTTQAVGPSSDNTNSAVQSIGFDFPFMGEVHNSFSVNANGIIRLGNTPLPFATYTIALAGMPLITALGGDLEVSSTGKIHFRVTGTAPDRCLVIEFLNMGLGQLFPLYQNPNATYQVRLYETTGVIEFVYGPAFRNSGVVYPSVTFNTGISSSNTATTVASVNTTANTVNSTLVINSYQQNTPIADLNSPVEGARKTYRFTPSIPAAPVAAGSTQCGTGIPSASVTGTGTMRWYDAATGGNLLQTGGSTYATPVSVTTTFYVAAFNGIMESSRVPVTVTVNQPDAVSATPSASSICIGDALTITAAQTGSTQNYTYSWSASPSAGSGITGPSAGTVLNVVPTVAGTYTYTVTATDGGCNTTATATISVKAPPAVIIEPDQPGLTICGSNPIILTAKAMEVLFREDFNGPVFNMSTGNTSTGPAPAAADWTLTPDGYSYGAPPVVFSSPTQTGFIMSNSDAVGGGSVNTTLTSPSINTTGYTSLGLTFAHCIRTRYSAFCNLQVSTDGVTWNTFASFSFVDFGSESAFFNSYINLDNYVNEPNFRFRFVYTGGWDWYWAIDDIMLTGNTPAADFSWLANPSAGAGLPPNAGVPSAGNNNIQVTPLPGSYTYSVTASTVPGCDGTTSLATTITNTPITALPFFFSSSSSPQPEGIMFHHTDTFCDLIASVMDAPGGNALGTISALVSIDGSTMSIAGQPYLQRNFVLSPSSDGPATVKLYALQSEFADYNAAAALAGYPLMPVSGDNNDPYTANIRVSVFTSSFVPGPGTALLTPTSVYWDSNNNWWEITVNTSNLGSFYVHTGTSGPLSIRLKDIRATNNGSFNRINWETAYETDNSLFHLERSTDGSDFTTIATLKSHGTPSSYSYNDPEAVNGMNYYRLRTSDPSGNTEYSKTVSAYMKQGGTFTIEAFPNPVHESVTLRIHGYTGIEAAIEVTDLTGKALMHRKITGTSTSIDLANLASGTYIIRYSDKERHRELMINKQ